MEDTRYHAPNFDPDPEAETKPVGQQPEVQGPVPPAMETESANDGQKKHRKTGPREKKPAPDPMDAKILAEMRAMIREGKSIKPGGKPKRGALVKRLGLKPEDLSLEKRDELFRKI